MKMTLITPVGGCMGPWPALHVGLTTLVWLSVTVNYFCERREGVKIILVVDGWLMAVDRLLKRVDTCLISDRRASINGDHREQVQETLSSTFLKRGTFMVLILNRCCFCQWMYLSLARDA